MDVVVSRAIIGGAFRTEFVSETSFGACRASRNGVSGQGWIDGLGQIGPDPTDPFPLGFTLSDTWGS